MCLLVGFDFKYSANASWETVNTASLTESSGEVFRIHISEATRNLLDRLGVYHCEVRGLTQINVELLTGVFYIVIYVIR